MAPSAKRIIAHKYEVVGVLGEGGTGIVYDAVKLDDSQPVALKVMHAALAGDRQIRGRFQREARILRRLEGDHLCPIIDFGELPGEEAGTTLLYIALPKITGDSLEQLLARGLLEVDHALDVMIEVLGALASAHAQGVIHRDLKPANILLEGGKRVIVVDFGMSKIVTGPGTSTTNLTTHNLVFGTPEYMSPEQARGDELDARCDVYAAGVILYEMLTGAPPFTGTTPLSVLTAHLTSDLEPPSKRVRSAGRVTAALESVVIHALARDREQRYPSAAALSAALVHARARPDDVSSVRPETFSPSRPSTDAFAPTMPDAIVVPGPYESGPEAIGTASTLLSAPVPKKPTKMDRPLPPAPIPSRPPPDPAPSGRTWLLAWIVVGVVSIAVGVFFALR